MNTRLETQRQPYLFNRSVQRTSRTYRATAFHFHLWIFTRHLHTWHGVKSGGEKMTVSEQRNTRSHLAAAAATFRQACQSNNNTIREIESWTDSPRTLHGHAYARVYWRRASGFSRAFSGPVKARVCSLPSCERRTILEGLTPPKRFKHDFKKTSGFTK